MATAENVALMLSFASGVSAWSVPIVASAVQAIFRTPGPARVPGTLFHTFSDAFIGFHTFSYLFQTLSETSTFANYHSEDSGDSGSRNIEFSLKSTTFLD